MYKSVVDNLKCPKTSQPSIHSLSKLSAPNRSIPAHTSDIQLILSITTIAMHSLPNADTGIDELAFYKQLAVLQCLHFLEADQYYRINRERGLSQPPRVLPEDPTDSTSQQEDPDIKLRKFLDCLAEVCASTRNGDTVTAVTVHLPSPGLPPEYVFVSNHLSQKAVSNAKDYIEGILNAFGQLQEYPSLSQSQEVAQTHIGKEVLRQAVCFDRKRLHYYLRKIKKNLEVLSKRSELDTFCKLHLILNQK